MNLFLKVNRILSYRTLNISYFFKRNRIEYYDRLSEVREKGNFEQWIKFFLQGIYESAQDSIETIDALSALHDKNIATIEKVDMRTGVLKKLFDQLEKTPIIDVKKMAATLETSYNTISIAIKKLVEPDILIQVDDNKSGPIKINSQSELIGHLGFFYCLRIDISPEFKISFVPSSF